MTNRDRGGGAPQAVRRRGRARGRRPRGRARDGVRPPRARTAPGRPPTVRVLATVLAPDGGRAEVLGHDVVRDADTVRRRIGMAGQFAAVDPNLTGRENLEMVGVLSQLPRAADRAERAGSCSSGSSSSDAGDRPVRTYSGGMRRRLDIARIAGGEAAGPVPRRADHRPGPHEPQRALGDDPRARRRRHHGPARRPSTSRRPTSSRRGSPSSTAGRSSRTTRPANLKAQLGNTVVEMTLRRRRRGRARGRRARRHRSATRRPSRGATCGSPSDRGAKVLVEVAPPAGRGRGRARPRCGARAEPGRRLPLAHRADTSRPPTRKGGAA